jgi:gliding motility-associated-like protein
MRRILLFLFVIITLPNQLFATHAAGLDLTYQFMGTQPAGQAGIEVTMTVIGATTWSDVYWTITDANGFIWEAGNHLQNASTPGTVTFCLPVGNYDLNLYEKSAPSAWNTGGWGTGVTYNLSTSTGTLSSGTLATGFFSTDPIVVATGTACTTLERFNYYMTAKFYRDCAGIDAPYNFESESTNGCGLENYTVYLDSIAPPTLATPMCPGYLTTCDGGTYPGIEEYTYGGTAVIKGQCTDWLYYIDECCRNNSITNLTTSGSIFVQTMINNTVTNSSPYFTNQPVSFICAGQMYCYNNGAVDPDGDDLVYSMITPMNGVGTTVTYTAPFSASNPFDGTTTFDSLTGNMCVVPNIPQVTVIAILVEEYRNGVLIGSVVRDIQVNVQACPGNDTPQLSGLDGLPLNSTNTDTAFCPGEPISLAIFGSDINAGDSLNISIVNNTMPGSNVNLLNNSTPNPQANFSWNTTINDTNATPYSLTLSIIDDACPYNATFTVSYNVTIIPNVTSIQAIPDICISEPPFALTQGNPAGGVYSGPGVSAGVFDPAAAGPGVHTIEYFYQNNQGCSGSAFTTISVEELPYAGIDGATTICDNAPSFPLFPLLGGNPSTTGFWINSIGDTVSSMFNPANMLSEQFTYSVPGVVCPSDLSYIDVTNHQMPVAFAGPDTAICGAQYEMLAIPTVGNHSWSTDANVSVPSNEPDVLVTAGSYGIHTFTWTEDNNGCVSTDEVKIEFIDPPFDLDITPSNYDLCPGDSITLHISDIFDTYLWHRNDIPMVGSRSNTISAHEGGAYTVLVANSICKAFSPPAYVNIKPLFDPTILNNIDSVICPVDAPIQFHAATDLGKWSGNGITTNGLFTPSVAGVGEHWINYVLDYNCNESDSILLDLGCDVMIYVPTAFTPNADEHNEFFLIAGTNLLSFEMSIYDRWGEQMFYTNDINNRWDGKHRGKLVPSGVFSYHIKAYGRDNQTVEKQGKITVIR